MPAERRPAPTAARSGRSSCRPGARGSRAIAVTSMRCGNGKAGASTLDRRSQPRRVAPRREPVDRPARPTDEEPVDRQPVVVDPKRQAVEVDGDARGAVPATPTVGSPTARAAAGPSCCRHAARRGHPGARGARPADVATRRRSSRGSAGTRSTVARGRARPRAHRGSVVRPRGRSHATALLVPVDAGRIGPIDERRRARVGDVVPSPRRERVDPLAVRR